MLCAVNFRKMNDKLKNKLKVNGCEHLIEPLKKVRPSGANQMAGGIEFVYNNWDVAPNGGILTDIIDYLKLKAKLPSDDKMEDLIRSRSQLYTSYSVKDKEGKYRSVVDIDSVIGLMRELLGN